MSDKPLVIYLAGDRELHAPEETLGVQGSLAVKAAAAATLPLAGPPGPPPAQPAAGHVQLLRLDRLDEALAAQGFPRPYELLFVLTDQQDPAHRDRDTRHLFDVLRRWCEARGHILSDVTVHQPANALDGAGAELIDKLDEVLGSAEGPIVLVAGGATPALQIAAHFASFQGVTHRDQVTMVQLEEWHPDDGGQPTGDDPPRRRPTIADTHVRVVERFHGVIGRRTVVTQALTLLNELDLPGAAQLLRASAATGVVDHQVGEAAQRLLDRLARTHGGGDDLAMLSSAVDLAELEWSRPGGSPPLAVWYAGLAAVDLVPRARRSLLGLPDPLPVSDKQVDGFNDLVAPRGRSDVFTQLKMSGRTLKEVAEPMLCAGPDVLRLPGRDVPLNELFRGRYRGDAPAVGLVWCGLVVALKGLRNDHAHQLLAATRTEVDGSLRDASNAFLHAVSVMNGEADNHLNRPIDPDRLDRIAAQLQQPPKPSTRYAKHGGALLGRLTRNPRLKVTDRQLIELLANPQLQPTRFRELPATSPVRERLRSLIDELREHAKQPPSGLRALLSVDDDGLGPLSLKVGVGRTTSSFRRLCTILVSTLPRSNQLLALADDLRVRLTGGDDLGRR